MVDSLDISTDQLSLAAVCEGFRDSFRFGGRVTTATSNKAAASANVTPTAACATTTTVTGRETPPIIIAIDSMVAESLSEQLLTRNLLRDMNKCLAGFAGAARRKRRGKSAVVVATGAWGCGAFGCDNGIKFLQQVLAASVTGVSLRYSVFEAAGAPSFPLHCLYQRLVRERATAGDVWMMLVGLQKAQARGGLTGGAGANRFVQTFYKCMLP